MNRKYNKILLKLSGEILAGGGHFGLDYDAVRGICEEIGARGTRDLVFSMVVGGGNIIRGAQDEVHRARAGRLHGNARDPSSTRWRFRTRSKASDSRRAFSPR